MLFLFLTLKVEELRLCFTRSSTKDECILFGVSRKIPDYL